ncbi:MAG: hypothetical protein LBQ66_12060 [Planctomycetaceae bacterium]|nr:hypothetical protein [Planctomycetaceae bacterium]
MRVTAIFFGDIIKLSQRHLAFFCKLEYHTRQFTVLTGLVVMSFSLSVTASWIRLFKSVIYRYKK